MVRLLDGFISQNQHWKVALALTALSGSQLLTFGLFAKMHAKNVGLGDSGRISGWVEKTFTLAHGLLVGTGLATAGLALMVGAFMIHRHPIAANHSSLSLVILGLTAIVLGGKLWFDAFFLTMVTLKRPTAVLTSPLASAQSPADASGAG